MLLDPLMFVQTAFPLCVYVAHAHTVCTLCAHAYVLRPPKTRICVILCGGQVSLFVNVDRDQGDDDITPPRIRPTPSTGAIPSWVSTHPLLGTWPPWPTLQAACVPPGRHLGAMNRHWRMLSAVCWALARVAHVSTAAA